VPRSAADVHGAGITRLVVTHRQALARVDALALFYRLNCDRSVVVAVVLLLFNVAILNLPFVITSFHLGVEQGTFRAVSWPNQVTVHTGDIVLAAGTGGIVSGGYAFAR